MKPRTIAIDGPAGSGKSTVGDALGIALGYTVLDTGVIYRLITYELLKVAESEWDLQLIEETVSTICQDIDVERDTQGSHLTIGGQPLADMDLHSNRISEQVPHVAKIPNVRTAVRRVQRALIDAGPAIVAGRDIGTVVAPDADLKLYLDVSLEERAARRMWSRGASRGKQGEFEKELQDRDRLDRSREESPLAIPTDALVFRTDRLSVDETVSMLIDMCGLPAVDSPEPDDGPN